MKRAKVMLTALAIFAVVGGAMAFKASKASQLFLYQKNAAGTACPKIGLVNPNPSGTRFTSDYTTAIDQGATTALGVCTTTVTAIPE